MKTYKAPLTGAERCRTIQRQSIKEEKANSNMLQTNKSFD